MKMKDLFVDEPTWTQHVYAKDINGVGIPYENNRFADEAVYYCLLGAIFRCYLTKSEQDIIIKRIIEFLNNGMPIHVWNDQKGRTFKDIKDLVLTLDI